MLSIVSWKWRPTHGAYRSHFGPETVNILKCMVKRRYNKPHRFICVTDDPKGLDPDIKVVPLWNDLKDIPNPHGTGNPSCYRRLKMFGPDAQRLFGKRFVSVDLDCVITADVTSLWDRPEDIVLWGDTNPGTYYNGSMLLMTAGCRPKVWEDFNPATSPMKAKAAGQFGSDQGWISYKLGPSEAKWGVADGVFSYRNHIRNRRNATLPDGARIIMFHGTTDPWSPHAARLGWVKENWRYDPQVTNGIDAINLHKGVAVFTNGDYVPILHLYDEEGEETKDLQEAVSFVAGRKNDYWSGLLGHFRKVSAQ